MKKRLDDRSIQTRKSYFLSQLSKMSAHKLYKDKGAMLSNEKNETEDDDHSSSSMKDLYDDLSEQLLDGDENDRLATMGAIQVALEGSSQTQTQTRTKTQTETRTRTQEQGTDEKKKMSILPDTVPSDESNIQDDDDSIKQKHKNDLIAAKEQDQMLSEISESEASLPSTVPTPQPVQRATTTSMLAKREDQVDTPLTVLQRGVSLPGAVAVPGIDSNSVAAPGADSDDGSDDSDRFADQPVDNLALSRTTSAVAEVVDYDELENQIRSTILKNSTAAVAVRPEEDPAIVRRKRYIQYAIFGFCTIILVIVTAIVSLKVRQSSFSSLEEQSLNPSTQPSTVPSLSPTLTPLPTLITAKENGYIKCGVPEANPAAAIRNDLEIDLCKAIAAAVFDGNASKVQLVNFTLEDRFPKLGNKDFEVGVGYASTMERDVYEVSSQEGFAFSLPYFYDGLQFGGIPEYVDCADRADALFGVCRGLRICVQEGTTFADTVRDFIPNIHVIGVPSAEIGAEYLSGRCNVVAGVGFATHDFNLFIQYVVRPSMNYTLPFGFGEYKFSKITLSIATREDDPEWTDFVNYVFLSLLAAEEHGITKSNATTVRNTSLFGPSYEKMFVNAIAAVGNYGDLYQIHKGYIPRAGLNELNDGSSGLLHAFPFGPLVDSAGPDPDSGSQIDTIEKRGFLRCGTASTDNDVWQGMDTSYCNAAAAALFDTNITTRITFTNYTTIQEGFKALANNEVDVLGGIPVTMEADVLEPTTGIGYTFSKPYFYEEDKPNQVRGDYVAMATRQDDSQWSSFLNWIVECTIFAEEYEMTQSRSNELPTVKLFGSKYEDMFRRVISAEGNYAEIYKKNVAATVPRKGRNLLNLNPFGPQHFALGIDLREEIAVV